MSDDVMIQKLAETINKVWRKTTEGVLDVARLCADAWRPEHQEQGRRLNKGNRDIKKASARPAAPAAFDVKRGSDVKKYSDRGRASRTSMSSGGGHRGGGGGRGGGGDRGGGGRRR